MFAYAMPGHTGDIEPGEYGSVSGFTVQYALHLMRVDVRVFIYEVLVIEISEFQLTVHVQHFQLVDLSVAQGALAIVINSQRHVRTL